MSGVRAAPAPALGHPRVEAAEKVTGQARYSCDLRLPGQLYGAILRSPHPHAEIKRIDVGAARRLPGVRAVLSRENAPNIQWHDTKLFDDRVRFVGDEVAAVAAESKHIAEQALALIDVAYEVLPFVLEASAALEQDAPRLHPTGNRAGKPRSYVRGDVERGFRDAEVIVDERYVTQSALHNSLEPHGCTVQWQGESLTVWESTQGIYAIRDLLAEALGVAVHHVRVIAEHIGGGFGSKQTLWKHTVLAALLAKATARPVQLVLDREAENLAVGNRSSTEQHVRIGARRDGTLSAIEVQARVAMGADGRSGEASSVVGIYQRLYRCANVRTEQTDVYTNMGPSCAFRAPGYVEGAFGLESTIDELAHRLGIDPLELRLRNYTDRDQRRDLPYSLDGLRLCYSSATAAFGWRDYERGRASNGKRRGIGIAAHEWGGGGGWPPAYVSITLNHDGSAEVVTGTQDIGTGTRTALAQIAAAELDLPLERVALRLGDTRGSRYAPVSAGSGTLATLGPAIKAAAADLRRKQLETAAELDVAVDEVPRALAPRVLSASAERTRNPRDRSIRTFGVQCVEVEVDIDTGEITVLRVAAAHDCGRIVNRALVDSQVIGGITQAIGFALTEERIVDRSSGVVLNANLEDYLVPTVVDVPPITHAEVGHPDEAANSIGAKGIGEPPIVPTAAAIANAVRDAVGARIRETPLSRERVLRALIEARKANAAV